MGAKLGFVYVAVILDAWSRRVVAYAISRRIDTRQTLAALQAAVEKRPPPPGCIHHSNRGGRYAADVYRQALIDFGLRGSMGRGNQSVTCQRCNSRNDTLHNWHNLRPDSCPMRFSWKCCNFENGYGGGRARNRGARSQAARWNSLSMK